MKVRFDATFDEIVDVNMRSWRASAAARALRRRDIAVFFVMFGAGAFGAALLGGAPLLGALATAAVVIALVAPFYARIYDWSIKRRISPILRESAGAGDSWPFEVEIDERGVHMTGREGASSTPWTAVRAVNDLPVGIEMIMGESGILMIRSRAFDSPEMRAAFLDEARKRAGAGTLSGAHGET